MKNSKEFYESKRTAYDELIGFLHQNEAIIERFKDKIYFHTLTKEEYKLIDLEKSLEDFNPILKVKNITKDKFERLKFSDLNKLEEKLNDPIDENLEKNIRE